MDEPFDAEVIDRLLAYVAGTSDLVGVVDEQSRVLYLNDAARKRLGLGDATGLTSADLFPPEVFGRYYDDIRPALLRSGTWHGELAVRTHSGEVLPVIMTIVASVGPGGEVGGLVTHGRVIDAGSFDDLRVESGDAEEPAVAVSGLADELAVAVSHGLIQPRMCSRSSTSGAGSSSDTKVSPDGSIRGSG